MRKRARAILDTAALTIRYIITFGGVIVLLFFLADMQKANKADGPLAQTAFHIVR